TSLGTCAGVYVKVFCERRGIDTSGIRILQKHVIDPQTHKIAKINMEIVLPDDFPQKYKSAVISSANQCSVKKVLANPPDIEVTTN
ncbi:MAG: OsmC family protein, partial [Bacteroidales bacterium]|nr:OsmC family protein [Bacteroidales bacterium]